MALDDQWLTVAVLASHLHPGEHQMLQQDR